MCLLSYFPEGILPDPELLRCGTRCNQDGHGWAIVIPGKDEIKVFKSLDPEEAIAEFIRFRTMYPQGPAMFHSRLTTHGAVTKDNCHPFRVNGSPRTVLGHNGVLPAYSEKGNEVHPSGYWASSEWTSKDGTKHPSRKWVDLDARSDTRIFAEDVVWREYPHLDSPKTHKRLTKWLGTGNKVLILTTDPRHKSNVYLFNEGLGEWHEGVWYSNSSYLPSKVRYGNSWWDDDAYFHGASKGADSWDTEQEDATGWPTTLGGTREQLPKRFVTMVSCDICGQADTVIASAGLCIHCRACNDCTYQIGKCICNGEPLPNGSSFRGLTQALDFGDEVDILDAFSHYRYMQGLVSRVESAQGWGAPKALASVPQVPEPTFSDTIDGSVDTVEIQAQVTGRDGTITMPL